MQFVARLESNGSAISLKFLFYLRKYGIVFSSTAVSKVSLFYKAIHFVYHYQVFFITVGEIFPLSCVAGGNPEPSYMWRQGKRVVSEGQSLVFENATINDTCKLLTALTA